jgi:hypothetical protein
MAMKGERGVVRMGERERPTGGAGAPGAGQGRVRAEDEGLIDRAPGDDVIVPIRMRRSSFDALSATDNGHSVPVSAGMIGLVRDREDCWTFVVWSGEPVWHGMPEQIPGNRLAAAALADDEWEDDDE